MNKTIIAMFASILMIAPAAAVDFTKVLTRLDGTPLTDREGKPVEPTLGQICENALIAEYNDEQPGGKEAITADEKFRRWKLANKVHGKDVTLSAEEIATLKKLVGKAYGPMIMGPAWSLLDPGAN